MLGKDVDIGVFVPSKSAGRVRLVSRIFFAIGLVIVLRILFLVIFGGGGGGSRRVADGAVLRPVITDRNGKIIAVDMAAYDIYVDKTFDGDAGKAALAASVVLGVPEAEIRVKIASKKFAYIAKKATPEVKEKLGGLGFGTIKTVRRAYPDENLYRHLVGSVDTDNRGISGIEKHIDDKDMLLEDKVVLSVDNFVQTSVRANLMHAMTAFHAKSAAGIVMDVNNGEILALVSLPDDKQDGLNQLYRNHATNDRFEVGSVLKIFNHALALENNFDTKTVFDTSRPLKIGNKPVTDSHFRRTHTFEEAFYYSSNLAAASIAMTIGAEKQKEFFKKLGFLDAPKLEIETAAPRLPPLWDASANATLAYGHGIDLSLLQVLVAANAIVNNGMSVPPTLFIRGGLPKIVQMVRGETALAMKQLMIEVVSREDGTGNTLRYAKVPTMGKTGTAVKFVNGAYSKDKMRTFFLAAFPINEPKYTMIIMLDEASNNGAMGAGATAAVVVRRILDEIAPRLVVK